MPRDSRDLAGRYGVHAFAGMDLPNMNVNLPPTRADAARSSTPRSKHFDYVKLTCQQFDMAADLMKLNPDVRMVLSTPYRELVVQVPVRLDDGNLAVFHGYRVQHNAVRGPYKGGIRYHPEVNLGEVRSLAALMSWKTALLEIPFGGAKGGMDVDPVLLSRSELQQATRSFTRKIDMALGVYRDIPAPDVNTNAQVMAWIMDEYGRKNGHSPAIVTGKPVNLGGSLGREAATGRGVVIVTREACDVYGIQLRGATVAIQGYGNVGKWTARLIHEQGAKVVAVSDVHGGVFCESGLDLDRLDEHVTNTGSVAAFAGGKDIDHGELLAMDVDILVPAALGGAITHENVETVQAKIVAEAANAPVTPRAEEALQQRGVHVLPDILVNGGGVTVSYFEWVQNLQQFHWDEERVNGELEKRMIAGWRSVYETSAARRVPLRVAAYMVALKRLEEATLMRI